MKLIRLIFCRAKNAHSDITLSLENYTLSLMYLAALTPSEYRVEIIDERISDAPIDKKAAIVGITYTALTYPRAYELADKYKAIGVPVIFGGVLASVYTNEALKHADSVVVGEAEHVWKGLLTDVENGTLKRIYKSDQLSDLKNLPIPRYDLCDPKNFLNRFPVQITRGCNYRCNFCCVRTFFSNTYRKRPIEDVINEIKYIKDKFLTENQYPPLSFNFIDDNIWGDQKYAKELFTSLAPLKINWFSHASFTLDDELFRLASQSGCTFLMMGFESLNKSNIDYCNKKQNKIELYESCISKIHEAGIKLGAYFMVGLPYDEPDCFDRLLSFLENNFVELPLIHWFTPLPGSEQYEKKDWQGPTNFEAILDFVPIYIPQGLTKKQYIKMYVDFIFKLFSEESIMKRLSKCNDPMTYQLNKLILRNYKSLGSPQG